MSGQTPIQVLAQAADEVLGTMFFSFVERIESTDDLMDGPLLEDGLEGRLGFSGPLTGEVRTLLSQGACQALSANFVGEEQEVLAEELIIDSLKELTNMVVGRFLALMEPERVCDLGLPEVSRFEQVDLSDYFEHPEKALILDTGDGALVLELELGG